MHNVINCTRCFIRMLQDNSRDFDHVDAKLTVSRIVKNLLKFLRKCPMWRAGFFPIIPIFHLVMVRRGARLRELQPAPCAADSLRVSRTCERVWNTGLSTCRGFRHASLNFAKCAEVIILFTEQRARAAEVFEMYQ